MSSECGAFACPDFMFAFAILHNIVFTDQRFFRCKAQSLVRNRQYIFLVENIDCDIGSQTWFQFQIRIMGGDYHLISNHRAGAGTCTAGTARISQANLCHYSFECVVRISVYRETYTLSFFHVGHYLHLCQVRSNGEQGRSFESGSNSLSGFHITADNYTVNR